MKEKTKKIISRIIVILLYLAILVPCVLSLTGCSVEYETHKNNESSKFEFNNNQLNNSSDVMNSDIQFYNTILVNNVNSQMPNVNITIKSSDLNIGMDSDLIVAEYDSLKYDDASDLVYINMFDYCNSDFSVYIENSDLRPDSFEIMYASNFDDCNFYVIKNEDVMSDFKYCLLRVYEDSDFVIRESSNNLELLRVIDENLDFSIL